MIFLEYALILLSALILCAGFMLSVRSLRAPLGRDTGRVIPIYFASLTVLLLALGTDYAMRGAIPVSTLRYSMLLFSGVLLAVATALMRATHSLLLGILVIPVVLMLQMLALFFDRSSASRESLTLLGNTLTTIHVLLFLVSYAFLFMGAGFSAMFLLMDRLLKDKTYPAIFFKLPGLARLDGYSYGCALAGLGLLTGAIAVALTSTRVVPPGSHMVRITSDFTILATLVLWGYYAVYLFLRFRMRLAGRKAAYGAIAGVALMLVVYFSGKTTRQNPLHGFATPQQASSAVTR